ncbi:MAG: hypothetical protein A4E32_01551 [Methanomassiliicoccales archaeon PtaU1.Bin124]|nr:MAG: hypothetical protein A4E32_01551 [Methanomassiliicoccales archaeon PtaU1.Bin124]
MAEFEIGSVVVDENGARKDIESFAVCYDYLTKVDPRFVRSQRGLFFASIIAIGAGAGLAASTFVVNSPLLIPGIALAGVGAAGLAGFLFRRPKGLTGLKKVYRPLALVPLNADGSAKAALDCTGMMWQKEYGTELLMRTAVDDTLSRLPATLSDNRDEKEALDDLRSLDAFRTRAAITASATKEGDWLALSSLATPAQSVPARSMAGLEWPEAERTGKELTGLVESCRSEVHYIEETTARLNEQIEAYLQTLDVLYKDQVDRSCNSIAKISSETERSPRFFDPLINSFLEDVREGLTMVEKASQRELDLIDGRLQLDQSYIDLLLDRMSLNVRLERDRLRRDGGLRDSRLAGIDHLAETIAKAKGENLKPVQPGLAEAMRTSRPDEDVRQDPTQALLDKAQDGAGIGVFISSSTSQRLIAPDELAYMPAPPSEQFLPSQHRMADPLTESQLKRYDTIAARTRKLLDDIMKDLIVCSGELGDLAEDLKAKVTGDVKRVEMQLLAGKRAISSADISKEEDHQRIRKDVDQLEDLRAFVVDMMVQAEGMMVEGAVRHLRPYAERAAALEAERVRLVKAFNEVSESCIACERSITDIMVRGKQDGRYHVPYWIVASRSDGEAHAHIYPVCGLDAKGLTPKFPQLAIDLETMAKMWPEKEGVDLGLVSDISKGRTTYRQRTGAPWLDTLIVDRGVRRLGKGA